MLFKTEVHSACKLLLKYKVAVDVSLRCFFNSDVDVEQKDDTHQCHLFAPHPLHANRRFINIKMPYINNMFMEMQTNSADTV